MGDYRTLNYRSFCITSLKTPPVEKKKLQYFSEIGHAVGLDHLGAEEVTNSEANILR